ncbi:protein TIFY 5A [Tripterygium wilfordii]|uniref:Protein TIFY 5A n=1 Tax=Tripterygium wilfordii TaxID=458696 RepID=A0A7J7CWF9_TRIWF|nr:protein TIFY 5A-like [Tripterygium wilfordii]KAF5738279.1 protein TIFY 5A [Tripterygium wilfordii]
MSPNCNLELQLFPLTDSNFVSGQLHQQSSEDSSRGSGHEQQPQLTVSDDSELQGRAILSLATTPSREIDEGMKFPNRWETASSTVEGMKFPSRWETVSSTVPSQLTSLRGNSSTKMSLQRFLQKRKSRMQATFPYTFNH